ncbi:MAG: cellulase family glycosylhydrolase [Bacteroidota bacterium]
MNKRILPVFLLLFVFLLPAYPQQAPFSRGINLTNWFQSPSAAELVFGKYTKESFEEIQSLGVDVIRLPINLHNMSDGAPDYTLSPIFLNFLDQAVDWAEEVGIHLILDNHTFDPAVNTPVNIDEPLLKVWKQLAGRYANRSEYIHYEVLNEPHGISNAIWSAIQQAVIDTIRTVDQTHSIIVGGVDFNGIDRLNDLPVYSDTNLIYTFHLYDPFIFTHQGASWVDPSLVDLANIPFPYEQSRMPNLPSTYQGTWIENVYNDYSNSGTVAALQNRINIVSQFRQNRNVPVFCGEFGVFIPNSNNSDRVFWYDQTRRILEAANISWTIWDYEGGFGIYNENGNGQINHDLNIGITNALGFTAPPQTPFVQSPDSSGIMIYSDFLGQDIEPANNGGQEINYYVEDFAAYGDYHVKWRGPAQYEHLGFDFKPNRDFSFLLNNNFALDLFIRGTNPTTEFDIRFLDSFEPTGGDLPWRMRVKVDASDVSWDGKWNHLHIPLSSFTEHGSWDGSTWHDPRGEFDWTKIDFLEIVSEYKNQQGFDIWFDQIQITNQDTAMTTTSIEETFPAGSLSIFPNPVKHQLQIISQWEGPLQFELWDSMGRLQMEGNIRQRKRLNMQELAPGIYLLKIRDRDRYQSIRRLWKE